MERQDSVTCPSCGGAGGGPLGRAGGRWDTEDYVGPRCAGVSVIAQASGPGLAAAPPPSARPGVVKAPPPWMPGKKRAVGEG